MELSLNLRNIPVGFVTMKPLAQSIEIGNFPRETGVLEFAF